mmetsp:Transcript_132378/g.369028  ORF Transcript_132378/g.369028 Transcript_132378/m.369028 type:complete len:371 (+) Transcript_132378:284-1396(+)
MRQLLEARQGRHVAGDGCAFELQHLKLVECPQRRNIASDGGAEEVQPRKVREPGEGHDVAANLGAGQAERPQVGQHVEACHVTHDGSIGKINLPQLREGGQARIVACDMSTHKAELRQPGQWGQRSHVATDSSAVEAELLQAGQRCEACDVARHATVPGQVEACQALLLGGEARELAERHVGVVQGEVQSPEAPAMLRRDVHELAALLVAETDVHETQAGGVRYDCLEGPEVLRLDDRLSVRTFGKVQTRDRLAELAGHLWHTAFAVHGPEGELHVILTALRGHELGADVFCDVEQLVARRHDSGNGSLEGRPTTLVVLGTASICRQVAEGPSDCCLVGVPQVDVLQRGIDDSRLLRARLMPVPEEAGPV